MCDAGTYSNGDTVGCEPCQKGEKLRGNIRIMRTFVILTRHFARLPQGTTALERQIGIRVTRGRTSLTLPKLRAWRVLPGSTKRFLAKTLASTARPVISVLNGR